ncbi:MAG: hypothetical protein A3J74_08990 [Elusimicrobia bacterium RIFCSPHIGHO2_02_FULL_57_9]|nr:MAG: hypothetical protein A3J74_08990 [Elusimicrobia bacterium RIFCSPHIGHO2_02_FULL_57_9]
MTPFAARVAEGMRERGYTLRRFCRSAGIDPSFFSKVLSGKRSPPEQAVLRRIARLLEVEPAELIVLAGRIPNEWRAVWENHQLFKEMNELATGRPVVRPMSPWRHSSAPRAHGLAAPAARGELSEELL